ncbi:Zinc finger protein ZAT9 [Raphanus sativus]|nr:Zinc finger protein ZAT9 [Raphanus sativus]
MESYYKCRFCLKSFVNGRALGGHMRSHVPSFHKFSIQEEEGERASQLNDETESDVSSSSSMMDQKVANESETESSSSMKITRKRSKRTRKLETFTTKKSKTSQLGYKTEPECEPPHSSASDTTRDKDLAFCLMLLSRDKWKNRTSSKEVVEEISTEGHNKWSKKGRFTCETCGKVFKSYQALGGHRASHKKNRVSNKTEQRSETEFENVVVVVAAAEKRIHECPICLRVFASGQALGGHKRSHGIGNLSVDHHQVRVESVKQKRMVDLNLPAPTHEEEVSIVFQ